MHILVILTAILAFASIKTCGGTSNGNDAQLESFNKQLLRTLQQRQGLPIPSAYLALRLSNDHNHAFETDYLNKISTDLHGDIQSSLSRGHLGIGLLPQYTMCLKASCSNLSSVTFDVNGSREKLLFHLKKQMLLEKENINHNQRPLSSYFAYSEGILALCLAPVRVNVHVTAGLLKAVEDNSITDGGVSKSVDTLAMAGTALSCVKTAGYYPHNTAGLEAALDNIKQKLVGSIGQNGHIGNQFSTALAVQALLAMGSQIEEQSSSMIALRAEAWRGSYHNPIGLSYALIALQQKTYLDVKNIDCQNEKDNLVPGPVVEVAEDPEPVPPRKVKVSVEVVKSGGEIFLYTVHVLKGSSLMSALEHLQRKNTGFTFEVETSQWGPFLSNINGEQARQSDRRSWHLLSDHVPLSQGIEDFKIRGPHEIVIKNVSY